MQQGVNGTESPASRPQSSRGRKRKRKSMNGHQVADAESSSESSQTRKPLNGAHKANGQSPLQKQRRELPIWLGRKAIIEAVRANDTVVILGETGSGKTTQVPQYLHEAGFSNSGIIGITQTRRVAASTLAARISQEQGTVLGELVGYSVRFEDVSGPSTKIKFLTDGMLVRDLLSEPLLESYSVIIVDEAHERTLLTDLVIARLREIQKARNPPSTGPSRSKPLKIVIMSATLDAEKFSAFYNGAKILYVQGRQHPVKIYYTPSPPDDWTDAALRTFFQLHVKDEEGDVLVFLPGQEAIESLYKSINAYAKHPPYDRKRVEVHQLFSNASLASQRRTFVPAPRGTRKCILATNIAETAITIPGVKFVIDTGVFKEKNYSTKRRGGVEALLTRFISKASAIQRAGRAGREGPGFCYRLYTEEMFRSLPEASIPEIQRSRLASPILWLKSINIDPEMIQWMDSPSPEAVQDAVIYLFGLQAFDNSFQLTEIGKQLARLPLEPSRARAIVASKTFSCTSEVLDITAALSANHNIYLDSSDLRDQIAESRQIFRHPSGDHATLLNVIKAYRDISKRENRDGVTQWCRKHFLNEQALVEAMKIREQLVPACEKLGIPPDTSCGPDMDLVLRSLLAGLPMHVAQLHPDSGYRQLAGGGNLKIHPSSVLVDKKSPTIVYEELFYSTQVYARWVSSVTEGFVLELPMFSHGKCAISPSVR